MAYDDARQMPHMLPEVDQLGAPTPNDDSFDLATLLVQSMPTREEVEERKRLQEKYLRQQQEAAQKAADLYKNSESKEVYDNQRQRYDKHIGKLGELEQKYQEPTSDANKWLRLSAALAKPTTSGRFGESMGYAAESLADSNDARRKAEQERLANLQAVQQQMATTGLSKGNMNLQQNQSEIQRLAKAYGLESKVGELGANSLKDGQSGDMFSRAMDLAQYKQRGEYYDYLDRTAADREQRTAAYREGIENRWDPMINAWVEEAKQTGKEIAPDIVKSAQEYPTLTVQYKKVNDLEKIVKANPNVLNKSQKWWETVHNLGIDWLKTDDSKKRAALTTRMRSLMDPELKDFFGPQMSEWDSQMIMRMSGVGMDNPEGVYAAIGSLKKTVINDLEKSRMAFDRIRKTTGAPAPYEEFEYTDPDAEQAPEDTIVDWGDGTQKIMKNGEWVPFKE